ncbi:MAG: N-acetyltransferase family protein [Acidimicrobiales bacterium]
MPERPTLPEGPGVTVRLATTGDAEEIRQIYNREVQGSTATFDLVPRSLAEQQAWLAARSGAFVVVVAEMPGPRGPQVAGFASLSPYKERPAYRTTVEDSVYVHHGHQGFGIGRMLLTAVLDRAAEQGFHAVMARIEASRAASRALHTACGFELVGIEREVGRKFNRWLDVALMQCLLHRHVTP